MVAKKRPVRWSNRALDELDRDLGYIAQRNEEAAHRIKEGILEGLDHARSFPMAARIVPEEGDPSVREILREPFRVIYEIMEGELRVLTVRRMEQAPLEPGASRAK